MFTEQDRVLITELGLDRLPEEQQAAQLQNFYNALKLRVGIALEDKLTDQQLIEFEKVSATGDQATVNTWLTKAIPDYDRVMTTETETLKQEIKQTASDFRNIINEANN
jgi:hypothetical protein